MPLHIFVFVFVFVNPHLKPKVTNYLILLAVSVNTSYLKKKATAFPQLFIVPSLHHPDYGMRVSQNAIQIIPIETKSTAKRLRTIRQANSNVLTPAAIAPVNR